ncbi:PspC domain-containing protein [Ascidiimonas sp. W6]|uniref:PspC domain-containing protein n=1 Tax=Ascidiimonas meishanensis TaxID=3128903 RepID=UPI0030EC6A8B
MNKTININLAGMFFHIDEDAYTKLQRYLDAIKRSFSTTQGRDEIIADIEARIAELFLEKMENDRQVMGMADVDYIINIMGQPEDYLTDDDIFEDEPPKVTAQPISTKKLYRDIDNKYIGGVCSGIGHYIGLEAIWVRLIFILVAFSTGFGFLAYILFWILVPEANSTAKKLAMTGEAVNISSIEKKIKEGFDGVAEKVKNVDYEGVGNKVKSSSKSFFDSLGDLILFFFKVIGKLIGIILLITGASTLIGLFVGLFSVGIADIISIPGVDFVDVFNTSGLPIWLISLITFFAVGIPFFFLFYLGLKILVSNLKSIGNIAKFSLLGLWIISVISLVTAGVKQASEYAFEDAVIVKEQLFVSPQDTVTIKMNIEDYYDERYFRNSDFDVVKDENGLEKIISDQVSFTLRKSKDSLPLIRIRKEANGSSFQKARERAGAITYSYVTDANTLFLNSAFVTDKDQKFRDQEVNVQVYLPTGTIIKIDNSAYNYIRRTIKNDQNYSRDNVVGHTWKMGETGELECLDCLKSIKEDDAPVDEDTQEDSSQDSTVAKDSLVTINKNI